MTGYLGGLAAVLCACSTPSSDVDAGPDPTPTVLASWSASGAGFRGVALDATHVYWTQPSGLWRVSKLGGEATQLAVGDDPAGVVVVGDSVYWADRGADDGAGAIRRVAITGGDATSLATGEEHPTGLVAEGDYLYWFNDVVPGIKRMPIAGGTVDTLDATGQRLTGIAVHDGRVIWVDDGAGTIHELPPGGAASLLASASQPWGVVADAAGTYFTTPTGVSQALGGGATSTIATGQTQARGLAIDGDTIYWTDLLYATGSEPPPGAVRKVARGGGAIEDVATMQDGPNAIAIDDDFAYWINEIGGELVRAGKGP